MSTPGTRDMDEGVRAYAQHLESSAELGPSGPPAHAEALVTRPDVASVPSRTRRSTHAIQYFVKRVVDYVGAACGLLLISPFLLVVAVLIKLDSPGPVLFRQTRIGKYGRPFVFYKFRTMRNGCDSDCHREHVKKLIQGELGDDDRSSDGSFKLEDDPRITKVGRVLRRTSIDELPQLLNVLKGEMSLIGPRPPLPYEVELYTPRYMRRLETLPGMTGLWQVSGRAQLTYGEMVDLDIEYADTWSLAADARILLKTFSAVVGEDGAG